MTLFDIDFLKFTEDKFHNDYVIGQLFPAEINGEVLFENCKQFMIHDLGIFRKKHYYY